MLQRLQDSTLRSILNKDMTTPTTELHDMVMLDTLATRRMKHGSYQCYKYLHQSRALYVDDMLSPAENNVT